jgi:hypothetical protein
MKIIYKRLATKSGSEQDVLYVPDKCVITHSHYLGNYLYSPKEDWLRKYGKANGIIEREIEVDEGSVNRLMEIGELYIDPRGKIHDIDNEEFRRIFDSLAGEE